MNFEILNRTNVFSHTSSNGNKSLSSSFNRCHFSISGAINISIYSFLLSAELTESARVPMASYRISKFLCWYLEKANTRFRRMGSKYGTRSSQASSSRVANALQAASCTRLLLSRTLRKSFHEEDKK